RPIQLVGFCSPCTGLFYRFFVVERVRSLCLPVLLAGWVQQRDNAREHNQRSHNHYSSNTTVLPFSGYSAPLQGTCQLVFPQFRTVRGGRIAAEERERLNRTSRYESAAAICYADLPLTVAI